MSDVRSCWKFNRVRCTITKVVNESAGITDKPWRLYTQTGQLVASGDVNANSLTYNLQDADKGIYYLLVDSSTGLVNPFNYGFSIKMAQNQFTLAFNSLTDATIPAGQSVYYNFHLDASSLIGFDSLTNNSNFSWQLTGPSGQVFSQNMATSNQNDAVRIIPARILSKNH